mgnify:CR=1 FL=1
MKRVKTQLPEDKKNQFFFVFITHTHTHKQPTFDEFIAMIFFILNIYTHKKKQTTKQTNKINHHIYTL